MKNTDFRYCWFITPLPPLLSSELCGVWPVPTKIVPGFDHWGNMVKPDTRYLTLSAAMGNPASPIYRMLSGLPESCVPGNAQGLISVCLRGLLMTGDQGCWEETCSLVGTMLVERIVLRQATLCLGLTWGHLNRLCALEMVDQPEAVLAVLEALIEAAARRRKPQSPQTWFSDVIYSSPAGDEVTTKVLAGAWLCRTPPCFGFMYPPPLSPSPPLGPPPFGSPVAATFVFAGQRGVDTFFLLDESAWGIV